MASFRVWGRTEHIGVKEFLAIASAVPDPPSASAIVLTSVALTLEGANTEKARLMVEMGARVRAVGGRVVDVEEE